MDKKLYEEPYGYYVGGSRYKGRMPMGYYQTFETVGEYVRIFREELEYDKKSLYLKSLLKRGE